MATTRPWLVVLFLLLEPQWVCLAGPISAPNRTAWVSLESEIERQEATVRELQSKLATLSSALNQTAQRFESGTTQNLTLEVEPLREPLNDLLQVAQRDVEVLKSVSEKTMEGAIMRLQTNATREQLVLASFSTKGSASILRIYTRWLAMQSEIASVTLTYMNSPDRCPTRFPDLGMLYILNLAETADIVTDIFKSNQAIDFVGIGLNALAIIFTLQSLSRLPVRERTPREIQQLESPDEVRSRRLTQAITDLLEKVLASLPVPIPDSYIDDIVPEIVNLLSSGRTDLRSLTLPFDTALIQPAIDALADQDLSQETADPGAEVETISFVHSIFTILGTIIFRLYGGLAGPMDASWLPYLHIVLFLLSFVMLLFNTSAIIKTRKTWCVEEAAKVHGLSFLINDLRTGKSKAILGLLYSGVGVAYALLNTLL